MTLNYAKSARDIYFELMEAWYEEVSFELYYLEDSLYLAIGMGLAWTFNEHDAHILWPKFLECQKPDDTRSDRHMGWTVFKSCLEQWVLLRDGVGEQTCELS